MTLSCISECFSDFRTPFASDVMTSKALVIPAAYFISQNPGESGLGLFKKTGRPDAIEERAQSGLLVISHGTAIMLLFVYVVYLVFQLKTHAYLFQARDEPQGEDQPELNEDEEESVEMAPLPAGIALLLVTVVTAFAADYREYIRSLASDPCPHCLAQLLLQSRRLPNGTASPSLSLV